MNDDSIKLLKSLSLGSKMCIESIDDIFKYLIDDEMRLCAEECLEEHKTAQIKIDALLKNVSEEPKEPNIMAKGMTKMKVKFELLKESDDVKAAAGLITDGCNMGIKLLNHYLNDYENAQDDIKNIAYELISSQEKFMDKIKNFL